LHCPDDTGIAKARLLNAIAISRGCTGNQYVIGNLRGISGIGVITCRRAGDGMGLIS